MGTKIYVGNLPYSATDETLNEQFSRFGSVSSSKVIMDRDTNRSKGFGFIEMSTADEAEEAIANLDGAEMDGRALKVSAAKPQAPRENRNFRY